MLFVPRIGAALLSLFGVRTALLASVGLHGVIAFTVAQRTRDLGIRLAPGGPAARIVRLVVAEGPTLAGIGWRRRTRDRVAAGGELDPFPNGVRSVYVRFGNAPGESS